MTPRWPLPESPPALDLPKMQLTQFVQKWQQLKEKQDHLLTLIEQRRQVTGAPQITEAEAQALAEGADVIRRLDAIITGILETLEAEEQQ